MASSVVKIPDLDEETLQKIAEVLREEPRIAAALYFGSFAKGRQREGSDLDIGVVTPHGRELNFDELTALSLKIEIFFDREVQLLDLTQVSVHLAARALREGKRIFVSDLKTLTAFTVKTLGLDEDIRVMVERMGNG